MSKYFITNREGRTLSDIINLILPNKTESLEFLVGYFYFSGIEELYENLEDKKMRILVGLEIESELQSLTHNFNLFANKKRSSRQDIRHNNYDAIVKLFNETDYFESKKQEEAFKIYFNKIKDGTLEIRKTKEPSHAKMYIFSYKEEYAENGETPGTVITGSSNLTYCGLRGQNEINVRFQDKAEYKEAKELFEKLWEDAIVLADKEHINEFEDNVIKHVWYEKIYSPYLLYLRVLYEYFKIDTSKRIRTPHDITKGRFYNFKYQEDAVRMGIDTINKHNGVIISDVVGLGKSIIASAIANNLNLRTIIISPPHLVPQWEDYRTDFDIKANVFSRGVLGKALDFYNSKLREGEQWLIIVDEAHNYRNEFTQDYDTLKKLCVGNKVMLMTATPFNNQPSDIYSMIKLFQIPTKSTLQTVDNLGQKFRELISSYKTLKKQSKDDKIRKSELKLSIDSIAKEIRVIISPLIIRRSRIDLAGIPDYKKDLEKQGIKFSEVNPPELLDYDLGDLKDLYLYTLQRISHQDEDEKSDDKSIDFYDYEDTTDIKDEKLSKEEFKAARYNPVMYVLEDQEEKLKKAVENAGFEYNLFKGTQRNLAKFMRTLLVRRFESSQKAFMVSLTNMLENCKNIVAWAEKRGTVPVFKKGQLPDIEALYDSTNDNISETADKELETAIEKLETRGMFEIKVEYLKPSFFDDLNSDIELLQDLKYKWSKVTHDPKLDTFVDILTEQLEKDPERKIVVFSQYADTVNYLGKKLENKKLPVYYYTSDKAFAGNKETIKVNFDAGIEDLKQSNEYKVLIATDAISEGYNLHRAGTIFNYDIPYNPTRVIQRIGRINRINKKMFDELHIFNYFPTDIGEAETNTKKISTLKMDMIHAIMGEDTKVLTSEEELRSYFKEEYLQMQGESEQKSWDTDYRAKLNQLIGSDEMKEALKLPLRTKTRRKTEQELPEGVLIFAKKGNDYVFKFASDKDSATDIPPQDAFKLLKCDQSEKRDKVSDDFEELYNIAKKSLFSEDNNEDVDKMRREALDKIRIMIQTKTCDTEYLEDLKTVVEYDAISGYAIRSINRLKPKEYSILPEIISKDYISKALRTYDNINQGVEILILAEEIENI